MDLSISESRDFQRMFCAFSALDVSSEEFRTLVEIAEGGNKVAAARLAEIRQDLASLMPWVGPVGFSGWVEEFDSPPPNPQG